MICERCEEGYVLIMHGTGAELHPAPEEEICPCCDGWWLYCESCIRRFVQQEEFNKLFVKLERSLEKLKHSGVYRNESKLFERPVSRKEGFSYWKWKIFKQYSYGVSNPGAYFCDESNI